MLRRLLARRSRPARSLSLRSSAVRDPSFARLSDADVDAFRGMLGKGGVVEGEDDLEPMNEDWMGNWKGSSKLALRPKTTEEASAVLRYCHERRLAVVPQGGNTGLVGGSVPVFDEVVLSTSRMNRVVSLDEVSGIVEAEAGVVLEQLSGYLEERDFCAPLDLGAKGSCQIGGNAATNAGGIRFLRYGSLHGSVVGLEAVLADGTVLDCMSPCRKDNTGYDLKQLFIGSEGTLGLITRLAIVVPRRPAATHVAFVAVESWDAVQQTLVRARQQLGEVLSAAEFVDAASLGIVTEHLPGARDPLGGASHPFYMLFETAGSNAAHDSEKLDAFLEAAMEDGLVVDGTVAQDQAQLADLWQLREGVAEALSIRGKVFKYDLSVPVRDMYALVEAMRERLAGHDAVVAGYGHVGDGNLHLNVSVPEHTDEVFDLIEPFLFERVAELRGSVSAEHGMGQAKPAYLHLSKSAAAIETMRRVKHLFDPRGILNPYKLLPEQTDSETVSK